MRPHGTYTRYKRGGCRCDDCRAAARRYEKRRLVKKARGLTPYVDASPAREHLEWLNSPAAIRIASHHARTCLDAWWFTSAARQLGLTKPQLERIADGDIRRVRAKTARAILSLTTDTAWSGTTVPAGPVLAMVDQLVAAGWTKGSIGQEMRRRSGEEPGRPGLQIARGGGRVRKVHADAIAQLLAEGAEPPARPRRDRCPVTGRYLPARRGVAA